MSIYFNPIISDETAKNRPKIIHANGPAKRTHVWRNYLNNYFSDNTSLLDSRLFPEDLLIITWTDKPTEDSLIHKNFKKLKIEEHLTTLTLESKDIWVSKITTTINALESSEKDYVMGLDSPDVIVEDLEAITKAISNLKQSKSKVIFGAEIPSWPNIRGEGTNLKEGKLFNLLREVENHELAKYSLSKSPFIHLNAGLWIGHKNVLKKLFKFAYNLIPKIKETSDLYFFGGDQGFLRVASLFFYPSVILDFNCEIFLNLSMASDKEIQILSNKNKIISWEKNK